MKINFIPLITVFIFLTSCGYKGNLYLPKEDEDYSKFGPIQTGIGLNPNPSTPPKKNLHFNEPFFYERNSQ